MISKDLQNFERFFAIWKIFLIPRYFAWNVLKVETSCYLWAENSRFLYPRSILLVVTQPIMERSESLIPIMKKSKYMRHPSGWWMSIIEATHVPPVQGYNARPGKEAS